MRVVYNINGLLYITPEDHEKEVNPPIKVDYGGVIIDLSDRETAVKVRDELLKAYPLKTAESELPEEPTEQGIYISQSNRPFLMCDDGTWAALDGMTCTIRGFWADGTDYASWKTVCETLHAGEFPFIRLNAME